jgi:hypothetical protein
MQREVLAGPRAFKGCDVENGAVATELDHGVAHVQVGVPAIGMIGVPVAHGGEGIC